MKTVEERLAHVERGYVGFGVLLALVAASSFFILFVVGGQLVITNHDFYRLRQAVEGCGEHAAYPVLTDKVGPEQRAAHLFRYTDDVYRCVKP